MVSVGLAVRVINILMLSPLNPTATDAQRHVHDALILNHIEPIAALDLPLYQIWLHAILSHDQLAVALQILVSLITPLIWWLWMRLCLPRGPWALAGFALIALLPSWSAIFSFFMPETLLLPLLGLALCSSWLADKYKIVTLYAVSGLIWGLTITTKPTVAACFLIVIIWQSRRLLEGKGRLAVISVAVLQITITSAIYAVVPWRNHESFQTWIITPAFLPYNQIYYLSGKRSLHAKALFHGSEGNEQYAEFKILAPTLTKDSRPLSPISDWQSKREGELYAEIDYRSGGKFPEIDCPLPKRLQLTAENWLFFFLSDSWPDDVMTNYVCVLEHWMRWLWLPLALSLIIGAVRYRIATTPVILVLATTAVFMVQQSWILEGRYRKPWEGLLIVACLDLLARRNRQV